MENTIKGILAILLFICLADMPYGYYQFVRLAGMIGFIALAFISFKEANHPVTICYVALALLFQPLIKIAFSRQIWNYIDIVVGVGLILSLLIKPKNKIR